MAFSSQVVKNAAGLPCDKCRKLAEEDNPLFVFISASGRGRASEYHEIRLHRLCIAKIMEKAVQQ